MKRNNSKKIEPFLCFLRITRLSEIASKVHRLLRRALLSYADPSLLSRMATFTISHSINSPSTLSLPDSAPPQTDTLEYPLDTSSPLAQLQSLEKQLGVARNDMNERLTQWKDLLKDVEKEDKKKKKKTEDEEEEEQEEEEDA